MTSAISAGSSTLRVGGEDTHDDSRSGSLQGTAGYFVADHVEVFATAMFKVPMEHTAIYGRTIAAGAGSAYLVPVGGDGGWHAGPALWVGYQTRSGEIRGPSGTTAFEGDGPTAFAGLLARIAFNDRIAVAMSVGGYVESYSVNASGSSNEAGYGTDTGIRIGVTLGSR